jgi:hypothetical protein
MNTTFAQMHKVLETRDFRESWKLLTSTVEYQSHDHFI